MILYEPVIDREMWNSDIYEISSGVYRAVIRLTSRGFFTGKVYRAGCLLASTTADDLRDLVRKLNESITGAINGANNIRSEAVPGRDSRVAGTPEKARISARSSAQVYARAKQKDMGNPPSKTAFDWGQNIEREIDDGGEYSARSCDAGQACSVFEPGDAERESVGADVLS